MLPAEIPGTPSQLQRLCLTLTPRRPSNSNLPPQHLALRPRATAPKSTFLSLPAELRNTIYELTLTPMKTTTTIRAAQNRVSRGQKTRNRTRASWSEPALLRTTREIRREALPVYYGGTAFRLAVFLEDMGAASAWLASVVRASGAKTPFLSLTFVVHREAWAKLEFFRPFLTLARDVGMDLARAKEVKGKLVDAGRPGPPTFEMSRCTGPYIQRAFADMMELGKLAHEEGWSDEVLNLEFGLLVKELRESPGGKAAAASLRRTVKKNEKKAAGESR